MSVSGTSNGREDCIDGRPISRVLAAMEKDDASMRVEDDVTAKLSQVAARQPRKVPGQKALQVNLRRRPAPDFRGATALEAKGRVGAARHVAKDRKRDPFALDESSDLGWRLEGHHKNDGAQPVKGGSLVAQLREMLAARQSAQPAQENQDDWLSQPGREGHLRPILVPKGQRRRSWQRIRHRIDPLSASTGEFCSFGPQAQAQHRHCTQGRSDRENRERQRPAAERFDEGK